MAPGMIAGLMLASPLVKIAVQKLSSAITEQATLAWNFSRDLEYMKDTMESMAAVFDDAEKQSVTRESVRLWLKRLKHAAFDISDMMDDYQDIAKTPGMLSRLKAPRKKIALAKRMKKMRKRLERIKREREHFNFTESTDPILDQQHYNERETTSAVQEVEIFGRDAEKKEIIGILSAGSNKDGTTILPLYGLGGIGKSTLAQLVYNDPKLKQYYEDRRVWVYVSEVFNLKKIGNSIISQLQSTNGGYQNLESLQLINKHLEELLLAGNKILIVLDDIWQEDAAELKKLKNMLHVDEKGSMVDVLVTTRWESIANKICTNETYKLQPLADDVCWDIIKKYSELEARSNQNKFKEIGLDIAKKCGGVALAAQALGYMLKSKDLDSWLEINNSDIWNESFGVDFEQQQKKVLPSLKLSYERMASVLRLCFSYCAIFPKGHVIYEDDLVHQWISLDFIKKPLEGKEFVNGLLGMSFLQHSKLPNIGRGIRYTMHDLVHDLARSVVADELMVIDFARKVKKCEQKYCRYALLINYDGKTNLSDICPEKVQALHFSSCNKLGLRDGSFSFAKSLRILYFSESLDMLLPSSIGQLKKLKCFIAPQLKDKSLPDSIVQLSKLQYLNLRGSSQISTLPESISKLSCMIYLGLSGCSSVLKLPGSFCKLKTLVHLDMSNCFGITDLPDWLGNLTKLETLDLSRCSRVKEIPESLSGLNQLQHLNLSFCDSITRLPEAIGSLKNLQYLNLEYNRQIRELPRSFQNLQNLVHLDLFDCRCVEGLPEALGGLTSLEHLNMMFFEFGNSSSKEAYDAMGNLTNLKYLNLEGVQGSPDFIGTLTNLEYLILSRNLDIVSLPECIGNLKRLHTLNLSMCYMLKSLPDSIGNLQKLHTLDLSSCYNLNSLPDSIRGITTLKSLLIDWCSNELIETVSSMPDYSLTLPLFKVRADVVSAGCSNLPLLKHINVFELRIRSLENVRSLEEARVVKLSDKDKLSELTLMWTSSDDVYRFVDDEELLGQLVPPAGLKRLKLLDYRGQSFPSWFMDISHCLPNLVHITLFCLPECNNLPPFGQLPNLEELCLQHCKSITKIGKDICGGKGAFRRLSEFYLSGMEGLEEWCTTYSFEDGVEEFMFPVLRSLVVTRCPRLRLTRCIIRGSDEIISSLEGPDNSISHLTPTLWGLSCEFKNLRLFHSFTGIQGLKIIDCDHLTGFPESMQQFITSLQHLTLASHYISALPLPEWLGDLSSLESLCIEGYRCVESLPSCIGGLKKLKMLRIMDSPQLKRWCVSEENREKLAHIKNQIYW